MKDTTLKLISKKIVLYIKSFLTLLGLLTLSNELWNSFSGDNILELAIVIMVSLIAFDLIKYGYLKVKKILLSQTKSR